MTTDAARKALGRSITERRFTRETLGTVQRLQQLLGCVSPGTPSSADAIGLCMDGLKAIAGDAQDALDAEPNRLHHLMQQIADEAAMSDIALSRTVRENDLVWHVVGDIGVCKSLEYLDLRGLTEYSADGTLVRFVEVQS